MGPLGRRREVPWGRSGWGALGEAMGVPPGRENGGGECGYLYSRAEGLGRGQAAPLR